MGLPLLHGLTDLSHGRCLRAQKESLHKERCCPGFVSRISTDVEPDQMACTSETEGEAGDRGIKTQRVGGGQGQGPDTGLH